MSRASINICVAKVVMYHCRAMHGYGWDRLINRRQLTYWQSRLGYLKSEARLARLLRQHPRCERTITLARVARNAYLSTADAAWSQLLALSK